MSVTPGVDDYSRFRRQRQLVMDRRAALFASPDGGAEGPIYLDAREMLGLEERITETVIAEILFEMRLWGAVLSFIFVVTIGFSAYVLFS